MLKPTSGQSDPSAPSSTTYTIPPRSAFLLTPVSDTESFARLATTVSTTSNHQFSFLLLDPPWPNRSAARSYSYAIPEPRNLGELRGLLLGAGVDKHLEDGSFVAVWVTNKAACRDVIMGSGGLFEQWGVEVVEEWIWVKVTRRGEPVTDVNGLWRRPYEVCLVGRKKGAGRGERQGDDGGVGPNRGCATTIERRVILGVPDLHSRKPCLKGLVNMLLLKGEPKPNATWGVEMFARCCVSEWIAWGDEAVLFNRDDQWS